MIKNAKVSLSAVKPFEQAVSVVTDISLKLDRGIATIEQLFQLLTDLANGLNGKISDMNEAKETLNDKIRQIEEVLARFREQLSNLNEELSGLEAELTSTPESYTYTDSEGNEYEAPNPAYVALQARIASVEAEISSVEAQMLPYEQRFERATDVKGRLESHIEATRGVIYSLDEKKNTCKQLITELGDIKNGNSRKCNSARESLKKIEEVIASYLKVKMVYDSPGNTDMGSNPGTKNININININRNDNRQAEENQNVLNSVQQNKSITDEYIQQHQVKFNKEGRICEYEGRRYGGDFKTYEERLDRASADDPMRGYYTGTRGESKYIPCTRTVEGVVVTEILKKYGLDGIEYRNAEPDFEVCSEAIVQINNMTEFRDPYIDKNGVQQPGNFSYADQELATAWNAVGRDGKTDWTEEDIKKYRKANRLTWHEKCDAKTMVLVRSEINLYFQHSGGCAECKRRDSVGTEDGGFDE